MAKTCETCRRSYRGSKGNKCRIFTAKPEKCWAWTDDPDWAEKAKKEVEKYKMVKQGEVK